MNALIRGARPTSICCKNFRSTGRLQTSSCSVSVHPSRMDDFNFRGKTSSIVSVMGDLHLAPEQMHLFHQAQAQLLKAMADKDGKVIEGARVVQLGDLGHSKHGSGGKACFEFAKSFLEGFGIPYVLVLGNHDLEGEEYETDEENLEAWQTVFGQQHHWCAELGPALLIGLSTTRYRSNTNSHHEVYVDDHQFAWLESTLETSAERPVIIFTHAPPIGCGLKVLQNVHVKNRCAWLNHSDRPERFIQLVRKHPNIKLWFSDEFEVISCHFHLSHNYRDSISVVHQTAFVQTGVIGKCNRDGNRHSRVLQVDHEGYEVLTMDHEVGALRLDLKGSWRLSDRPRPQLPPDDELLCDPSAGWLCDRGSSDSSVEGGDEDGNSLLSDGQAGSMLGKDNEYVKWYRVGLRSILAIQDDLLVEYDIDTASPIGLVCKFPEGCELRLFNKEGQPATNKDGSDVASVTVVNMNSIPQVFNRNEEDRFYQIYQPNKWQARKKTLAAAVPSAESRI
ncbi:hypothetical protein CEUSTIGMA_g3802.t1 [Chlamydomonas eustigma]|uniref:Calcineurin-like phosphoesterase domain-containing protein n=1 Tax=Chlamydomonas eustigma TaxID=1157962 RepID=A0A250WZY1_9CHLO|nr:hypothetical protein CEUSTIGMA_g3802.t1 [Chlamydomonas eustigma]|eukprot:GAX76356.1 hypothetical protein CEUSTIGMA_g3802.t1 [Chlamydomonas eustigma]